MNEAQPAAPADQASRTWDRFLTWVRRHRISRIFAIGLTVAAGLSGLITVAVLTRQTADGSDTELILKLLYLDVTLLLALLAVVARRLVSLWIGRRKGGAGAGLTVRLVVLFSLIASIPAILVFLFSAFLLNFGLQAWFDERVSTAIGESVAVARAYQEEHRQSIRADALAMANDLNREAPNLARSNRYFHQVMNRQATVRGLPEAVVVDSNGRVLARSAYSYAIELEIQELLYNLGPGQEVNIVTNEADDRVRAVVRLNRLVDAFLIVGRFVDPLVLDHIAKAEGASEEYRALEESREQIQLSFVAIFGVVALIILLTAVWIGMVLATQLAEPISELIGAAERVREGDLEVKVPVEKRPSDELTSLMRAFNRMTSQLASQREGLMRANQELDERRRFTEIVLAGVSAGVIGLDERGCLYLPNRSASDLLGIDLGSKKGAPLADVVPEMAELLDKARSQPERSHQSMVKVRRLDRQLTLVAAIQAEMVSAKIIGYVLTFDDITELQAAQRTAAWADVARRIAHEIKNPLTPIQLSAERLKRKYGKEITSDTATFERLIETIVRQVSDIGRMVDEFSSFARMPQPTFANENLSELCRQSLFLEDNRNPGIRFESNLPEQDIVFRCDGRQINRVLTNLLKNAAESIEEKEDKSDQGWISLTLSEPPRPTEDGGRALQIVIEDNGRGFPAQDRDRLTEPYMTTRKKGTGLGLAIVKKIMEDHNGDLVLEDRQGGGARVVLRLAEESSQPSEGDHPLPATEMVSPDAG